MRLSPAKCLACVLIVALGLRLAAGWCWQGWLDRQGGGPFGFGDSDGYWVLAREIARGEPYQYGPEGFRVFRTPGYPMLLAPLFLLSDEPPIMLGRALNAVLDTAAVAAVGWLAWLLFIPFAVGIDLLSGGPRGRVGGGQTRADVERLAQRARHVGVADPLGRGDHLRADPGVRHLGSGPDRASRLALCPVLAAGGLLHAVARGLRQLDPLPPAGDARTDGLGRGSGGALESAGSGRREG